MASIYRKKNLAGKLVSSWYCSFRVPTEDGGVRQIHRSTGKATKKEAEAAARLLEEAAMREAGAGDIKSRAIMEQVTEAGELAMRGRLNPARAIQIIQHIRKLGGDDADIHTVRTWCSEWMKEKETSVTLATYRAYRTCTEGFIESLGERADEPIDMITSKDVRKFRSDLQAKGLVGATCNNRVKMVRTVFRDAVKDDLLIKNPADSVNSLDEDDSVEREPFTYKDVKKILKATPSSDWRGVILIGAYTGQRLGDIATLTTDNINMDEKVVTLIPQKTRKRKGKPVNIPMHPDLVDYFTENPPPPFKETPLFATLHNVPVGGTNALSDQFTDIMEVAGVDRHLARKKSEGAAKDVSRKGFHSLRHSFNSWLADEDVPEDLRMKMSAHTDSSVSRGYTHQQIETLRNAVNKIKKLS